MDKLYSIQAAASGNPVQERVSAPPPPSAAVSKQTGPVDWKRGEILAALECGATSKALLLSLQAITDLTGDQAFGEEATALTKPATASEAWKRAYKTYSRFEKKIREAGRKQDFEEACSLFEEASHEVVEIFLTVGSGDDPMADELGSAVYNALGQVYERAGKEAEREAYAADKGLLPGFDWGGLAIS